MRRILVIGWVALGALGCSRDKATDATPTTTPQPSAAVTASAAAAEPATTVSPQTLAAIPAEEDFEPQAATTITAANAAEQLATLEKEIKQ